MLMQLCSATSNFESVQLHDNSTDHGYIGIRCTYIYYIDLIDAWDLINVILKHLCIKSHFAR